MTAKPEHAPEMQALVERLRQLAAHYNWNARDMARVANVTYGQVQPVTGPAGTKPSAELLMGLVRNSDVRADWLLTGGGAMLRGQGDEAAGDLNYRQLVQLLSDELREARGRIADLEQKLKEAQPVATLKAIT